MGLVDLTRKLAVEVYAHPTAERERLRDARDVRRETFNGSIFGAVCEASIMMIGAWPFRQYISNQFENPGSPLYLACAALAVPIITNVASGLYEAHLLRTRS